MGDLLNQLSKETGLSASDIRRIILTAPRRYKTYLIPKRSGGTREIAQPAREVKLLQYVVVETILAKRRVHSSAAAYQKGSSILQNATAHAGNSAILKMDFTNFFPSIHAVDWIRYCKKFDLLDAEDIPLSTQILFRKAKREKTLKLSIGAPSSPMLSNILLYEFDEYVTREATKRNIAYTRYADDLTFSGQRIGLLKDMQKIVQSAVRYTTCPKLFVNQDKTNFVSTKFQRNVTGLILGNDGGVGIGREKLRTLRARVHYALNAKLTPDEIRSLSGYLCFVKSVDAGALEKISAKYGTEKISQLMSGKLGN